MSAHWDTEYWHNYCTYLGKLACCIVYVDDPEIKEIYFPDALYTCKCMFQWCWCSYFWAVSRVGWGAPKGPVWGIHYATLPGTTYSCLYGYCTHKEKFRDTYTGTTFKEVDGNEKLNSRLQIKVLKRFPDTMVSSGAGILLCLRNLRLQASKQESGLAVAKPGGLQWSSLLQQINFCQAALLLFQQIKTKSAKKSSIMSAPVTNISSIVWDSCNLVPVGLVSVLVQPQSSVCAASLSLAGPLSSPSAGNPAGNFGVHLFLGALAPLPFQTFATPWLWCQWGFQPAISWHPPSQE